MTIFKKLPLMAFGLGLGFITVMGMSSFKGENSLSDKTYGYDQINGIWVDISTLPLGKTTHCAHSIDLCMATFPSTIDPNVEQILPETVSEEQRVSSGIFSVVDDE